MSQNNNFINKKTQTSRVKNACQFCKSHKVACTDERPCIQCVHHGVECIATQRKKRKSTSIKDANGNSLSSTIKKTDLETISNIVTSPLSYNITSSYHLNLLNPNMLNNSTNFLYNSSNQPTFTLFTTNSSNISQPFVKGIIPVLQTPFNLDGTIDTESLANLIEDAILSKVDGFLLTAVASETSSLTIKERENILSFVVKMVNKRVPIIVGASSNEPEECQYGARLAEEYGASAYLVAVPQILYNEPPEKIIQFFERVVTGGSSLPLIIQDLQFNGHGMHISTIQELKKRIKSLIGLKIETSPAGPKYTEVRKTFGDNFFISGGWAVMQMIEALDRSVDAIIPESSMIRVYRAIYENHKSGNRDLAIHIFRELLPILSFTNQELNISIAFFKRLLVRKGIFKYPTMRFEFNWDSYNLRIADELISHYLKLENSLL
jgi:dihydrodipicolinate synthase/N-acetylneuraminate lyase